LQSGLSIVKLALSKPKTIVFAGARNPEGSKELNELAKLYPGRFFPVKLLSADKESNEKAISFIKQKVGRLDVVIANAGVGAVTPFDDENILETSQEVFRINSLGPLLLFQKSKEVLLEAKSPKFVVVTSLVGSIENGPTIPVDFAGYGASKAAVNWITRKIHVDYHSKGLVATMLHPGLVETDLSIAALDAEKIKNGAITTEVSAKAILNIVDGATVEKDGGVFRNYNGDVIPW